MAYDFARPLNVIIPELAGLITRAQTDLATVQTDLTAARSDLAMARADLAKPIVYFTAATIRVAEGDVGTNTITLTARRSGLSGTLLVPAAYIPGSATPADFPDGLPGAKTFTFVDGSDTATVSIVAHSNTDVEADKTFGYRLATGLGYRLGPVDSILVSILNDDTAGVATLANTPIGSTMLIASLPGATAAFATLSATSTDLQTDIDQLDARFDQLEAA